MQSNMLKTTGDLRKMLLEEISLLRDGSSNPGRLRAISAGSNAIIRTFMVEIAVQNTVCDITLTDQQKIGRLALVA